MLILFFISSLWEQDTPMVCMLNHWTGRDNIGMQGPAQSMFLYCCKYKSATTCCINFSCDWTDVQSAISITCWCVGSNALLGCLADVPMCFDCLLLRTGYAGMSYVNACLLCTRNWEPGLHERHGVQIAGARNLRCLPVIFMVRNRRAIENNQA